ncbi:MAG: (Fe-S)-binding protein [Proteobacteria bacterium]|nr:(Fe-S)-binding protein [Pseudomonadota bacterium]
MATRFGLQKWFPDFFDEYGVYTVFDLLVNYIKNDRIKLDKNRISKRIAYHDPCNYGRKSEEMFGHGYYEEPRWVLDRLSSNWTDFHPDRANQYCCGGGGGTLLTPYKEERFHYGRKKIDQIKRTGAELIVVPCHSCHGQIKALLQNAEMPETEVKYLWQVVAEALILEKRP